MLPKKLKFADRLIKFAANTIRFGQSLPKNDMGKYYFDQILRSSGSAALHYGEAQGTNTARDFVHKTTGTVKELKETRMAVKIMAEIRAGNNTMRAELLMELEELIAIGAKMVLNKR